MLHVGGKPLTMPVIRQLDDVPLHHITTPLGRIKIPGTDQQWQTVIGGDTYGRLVICTTPGADLLAWLRSHAVEPEDPDDPDELARWASWLQQLDTDAYKALEAKIAEHAGQLPVILIDMPDDT